MLEPNKVYNSDCLEGLKHLDDNSIDCCVTSPPYWALRDYGCIGQIGLEETPGEYVKSLLNVFKEVKRALKPEGTLWLNLGDSYAANRSYQVHNTVGAAEHTYSNGSKVPNGLKPKDLIGIPWRVAFALQDNGWYLRSDIIWSKTSCMPESVKDRPTKSHEYVFLLAKSVKYYYDNDSIKEKATSENKRYENRLFEAGLKGQNYGNCGSQDGLRNKRSVWEIPTQPTPDAHFATFPEELAEICIKAGCPKDGIVLDPFMGSGTTGLVATQLNRQFIGFELNPEYTKIANKKIYSSSMRLDMFIDKEKVLV